MRHAKRILQWLVGTVVGIYLAGLLLFSVPTVQRWLGQGVEALLEDLTGTEVEVGRLQVSWNGRLIVDDLKVWDLEGEEMLRVARVAARLSLSDLVRKRIRIGNAQLFGMRANLYQECEECDPNFKFLIDAFASKDTTRHTPIDLRISQLLVRRGNVKWNQRWVTDSTQERLSPAHIELKDLNVTAQLNCLTDDSLNVRVKRFDVCERSGLCINALAFDLTGNRSETTLSDFRLELPHSYVEIPALTAKGRGLTAKGNGEKGLPFTSIELDARSHLSPTDFVCLLPQLAEIRNEVDLSTQIRGDADRLTVSSIRLRDTMGQLRLAASGSADRLSLGKDSIRARIDINELYAESALARPYLEHELLDRIVSASVSGTAEWAHQTLRGNLNLHTPLGSANVAGQGSTNGAVDLTVTSDGMELGQLLNQRDLGLVALDMNGKGIISRRPDLTLDGHIREINYKGYRYSNIDVSQVRIQDARLKAQLAAADPNASFDIEGEADLASHAYKVKADITRLAPNMLNLTKKYAGTVFSGTLFADLEGNRITNMAGVAQLNDFAMTDSTGTYRPGDIHVTSRPDGNKSHLMIISPFLEGQLEGTLEPKVLANQVKHMVSNYLPAAPLTSHTGGGTDKHEGFSPELSTGITSFIVRLYSTEPLQRLLGVPLTLKGTTIAHGEMDTRRQALWMSLSSPGIVYGKEELRNIDMRLESNYASILANLDMQRMMKGRWVNVGMDTRGNEGKLTTRLYFNNNVAGEEPPTKVYAGDFNVVSRLWKDIEGRQGFEGQVLPSNLIISDTLWSIHPGLMSYYNDALRVDSFCVSQGDRFVRINGRASKAETDTLHAQIQRINLEYIFSLINFHAVELTGEATGDAYARSLFASPKADAYIRIPQFALNYGTMGDLDIHLNWGERPYSIFLNGNITDNGGRNAENNQPPSTLVQGYITPKKNIDYHGLDLSVQAERVNLEFINKWTSGIFDNMQGRATGFVHIFGPFKQINIEGDAVVNEGSLGVPYIGVRYHLENDTVHLRPNNIYFTDAVLYDPQGNPGTTGHQALVTGHLHHDHFKNLSYDILVRGNNILGYDFREFGDQNFYGTVYASGDITLKGHPGQVRIGINAHPERGTTFTYNASSPDKLTDTPFLTYVNSEEWGERIAADSPNDSQGNTASSLHTPPSPPHQDSSSDMFIDFDLDIDEQSTMNLLMDARSGDKIVLNGSGHMLAHFYNKGAFELLGTYRVSRGSYNLSLQEVIHKNFDFSPDGTITFKGEPYEADLDLQAVHTVPGVSLNDINPKANFSNATTRVNCLMNIGGKARAPRITFDFDIPNANEEEKQMVRSLISTEEERNMQVIYLLGIGRFYAYDYANADQNQSTTAMYSVLSSTLSGTINQMLSNMIGSSNWNFGANLRTGQDGWNDMDVEGMVQGNLLNNRLLINGNFGYRDTPVANSNFIGDFDVKYLLTRSGNVALKAYSETNDRYFTKSSLTTQGIGVLLKKDFTSWKDLVIKRKGKKKKKQ